MVKFDPEKVKFPTGPFCDGCPFRATSRGFMPPQGYSAHYDPTLQVWTRYEPGPLWLSAEYLFFAEAGGKDEAVQGMNLVGGTGGIYNRLLHDNTPLHRTKVAITNACKCRPVVHKPCPLCKGKPYDVTQEQVYNYFGLTERERVYYGLVAGKENSLTSFNHKNAQWDGYAPFVWQQEVHQSRPPDYNDTLGEQEGRPPTARRRQFGKMHQVRERFSLPVHDKGWETFDPVSAVQQSLPTCTLCRQVGGVPVRQPNQDYINAKPSREQIEECYQRYFQHDLAAFTGHTLVALGASAIAAIAGHGRSLDQDQGSIFEYGEMRECAECSGRGHLDRPRQKCPDCKGKGVDKCGGCGRYKHTKKCTLESRGCIRCEGSGTLARQPRTCPGCRGNREVPSDPGNPYVSTRLKPGQVMLATYHPAFLMRKPQYKRMLERDFSRVTSLREELEIEQNIQYDFSPTPEVLKEVFSSSIGAVDLETNSLYANRGNIEMISISTGPGRSVVAEGEFAEASDWLRRASKDPNILVIGQNWMQFDAWWVLQHWGIEPPLRCWDTRLAGHLHNPDTPNKLVYLVREYANPPIRGYWKTRNHYRNDKNMVNAIDTDGDFRVYLGQEKEFQKDGLIKEYWDEVYPTMQVAFDMRRSGWRVDLDALGTAHNRIDLRLHQRRAELPEWSPTASGERTENQSEAVRDYLYDTLRLPVQLDSKSHQPSAGWEQRTELENRLKNGHHSVEHLTSAEYAEALRFLELIGTLQEDSKLLMFLNPESKFLDGDHFHPVWNPAGTATQRWSCADPNIQQVPKCSCEPSCHGENPNCLNARFPFLPDHPDWVIGSTDYAQIEVIGFLWSAGQWDVLKRVLHEGLDAHSVMAEMLGMPRKDAKHQTFALVYGASDETIAAKSGRPLHQVIEARAQYLKTFTGVNEFRWHHISHAMRQGYVESCFGRRRYIWVRSPIGRAANQAANAPIQGIPPMIVRRAMRRLHKELPKPAHLLGNVHDEIIWCCPKEMLPEVVTCITDVMRSPVPEMPAAPLGMHGGLVLNVDTEVGKDWSRCVDIKEML